MDKTQLLAILRIGKATSIHGEGLSLRDALARAEYVRLRPEIGPSELVPLLRSSPDLVSHWLMYSEDKRTKGGFWLDEAKLEVGSFELPNPSSRHESIEEAVAHYVLRELDYWSALGNIDPITSRE